MVPLHEPSQHELHPGQSPAVQLCLLTAISWCFQDPGICQSFLVFGSLLLLFCVINRCIRKESGGTASHMAPGPRVEPVSFWWTGRRFQNNQMLPETASLQGRMMSGLLFLATGLFNRWKDWLLLKLQGSAPCMWGKFPKGNLFPWGRSGSSTFQASGLQAPELPGRHPRSSALGSPSVWNQDSALWKSPQAQTTGIARGEEALMWTEKQLKMIRPNARQPDSGGRVAPAGDWERLSQPTVFFFSSKLPSSCHFLKG